MFIKKITNEATKDTIKHIFKNIIGSNKYLGLSSMDRAKYSRLPSWIKNDKRGEDTNSPYFVLICKFHKEEPNICFFSLESNAMDVYL